jgi:hypothetical protein
LKPEEKMPKPPSTTTEMETAQAEAMKIMTDAKKLLEQTGLEVSFITRCPNGAKWPVFMLEVGQTYADIEAVRNGQR